MYLHVVKNWECPFKAEFQTQIPIKKTTDEFVCIKVKSVVGTWVAQWVEASAFSSGHDLRVLGSSPASGSLLSREPASTSLSLCLSLRLLVISASQINK